MVPFWGSIEVELKWALEINTSVVLRNISVVSPLKKWGYFCWARNARNHRYFMVFYIYQDFNSSSNSIESYEIAPSRANPDIDSPLHFFRTQEWGFAAKTPGGLEDLQIDDLSGNYWKWPFIVDLPIKNGDFWKLNGNWLPCGISICTVFLKSACYQSWRKNRESTSESLKVGEFSWSWWRKRS